MFEIKVEIIAPGLETAILTLAAAMSGNTVEKQPRNRSAAKPDPKKDEPTPQPEAEKEDPAPQPGPEETGGSTDENIPTVVELRAKAQEVGKTPDDKKAIKALLEKFGSESISKVPEDKRAEFLAALIDLEMF